MTKSYFVRQVTVQYKWIQYCGFFFFFPFDSLRFGTWPHVATGVRDRLRTECGNIGGAEAKRYLPTVFVKSSFTCSGRCPNPGGNPSKNKPGCCACCFYSLLCTARLFSFHKNSLINQIMSFFCLLNDTEMNENLKFTDVCYASSLNSLWNVSGGTRSTASLSL